MMAKPAEEEIVSITSADFNQEVADSQFELASFLAAANIAILALVGGLFFSRYRGRST
jgi:hypothetical protein